MSGRKVDWKRLSAKYAKLAAEVRHDADRVTLAGVAVARTEMLDLSARLADLSAIFGPSNEGGARG